MKKNQLIDETNINATCCFRCSNSRWIILSKPIGNLVKSNITEMEDNQFSQITYMYGRDVNFKFTIQLRCSYQTRFNCIKTIKYESNWVKPLTRIFRHSWCEDPAGGQEVPSRKSCCLRVPSSLALHTILGLPSSTWKKE